MRKTASMVFVIWVALGAIAMQAAECLPLYKTPEWRQLPGMTEVLKSARDGDPIARHLLASGIIFSAERNKIALNVVDREWPLIPDFDLTRLKAEDVQKIQGFAERGFFMAQRLMGELMWGAEMEESALRWYGLAAGQGDDVAQYNIGRISVERADSEEEFERILKWWELSGAQGNDGALKDLGATYSEGWLGKQADMKKAISYYERAAAAGNVPAAYLLGEIYATGKDGVPVDKDLAIRYYRLAAETEPEVAQMRQARQFLERDAAAYYRNLGDDAGEHEILAAAAERGNKIAELGLAINLCNGNSAVPKNLEEGIRRLTNLANTAWPGAVAAQGWLAVFLMREKRDAEAVYWYCRSLGNGNPRAYHEAPEFLKKHVPNEEQLELLRGVAILADSGNEEIRSILNDLKQRNILPRDLWEKK